jgi:hypothetical protein
MTTAAGCEVAEGQMAGAERSERRAAYAPPRRAGGDLAWQGCRKV